MLKKLVILTLMLGVIPHGHADHGSPASRTANGNKPAGSAMATSAPQQPNSPPLKQNPGEQQASDDPKAVRVILPPKDKYDYTSFWVSILLAGVGIGGIVVAAITLKKIERQTTATEASARIAKDNMAALINKERARIRVDEPPKDLPFLRPGYIRKNKPEFAPFRGEPQAIELAIFNRGGTTAHDVKMTCTMSIAMDRSDRPNRLTHIVEVGDLPASSEPSRHTVFVFGGVPQSELEAIHNGVAALQIAGTITYADVFDPQQARTTAFSFQWKSDIQWHQERGIRAVSDDCSGWYRYPPDANYAT